MMKAKIGLIQVPHLEGAGVSKRQDILLEAAEECLSQGADLVFFPEAFQYVEHRCILQNQEELKRVSADWKNRCGVLAKKYRAYVVPWDYFEEDGKIYNSSYVLSREGAEIGRFKKVHLTYSEQEWGLTNGREFPVFDLDFGRIGIMICFDNYWPESARCLALNGADIILYPLYGDTLINQWEIKMLSRAIDNSVYVASCQLDNKYDIAYTGMVNPKGEVVCRLNSPSCRVVEIEAGRVVETSTGGDPATREDIKKYLLKCRRQNAYRPVTEEKERPGWEDIFII